MALLVKAMPDSCAVFLRDGHLTTTNDALENGILQSTSDSDYEKLPAQLRLFPSLPLDFVYPYRSKCLRYNIHSYQAVKNFNFGVRQYLKH